MPFFVKLRIYIQKTEVPYEENRHSLVPAVLRYYLCFW
jgi:hypothetical protein